MIEERQKAEAEAQAKIKAVQDKARAEEDARVETKRRVEDKARADEEEAKAKVKAEKEARLAAKAAEERKVAEAKDAEEKAKVEAKAAAEEAKVEAIAAQEKAKREMLVRKTPGRPIGPKVKGLCIGMNIYQARGVLQGKLADKENVGPVYTYDPKGENFIAPMGILDANMQGSELYFHAGDRFTLIVSDRQGLVRYIFIHSYTVNNLFNATDMDASTFVQSFADAYHIPKMEAGDDMQSWSYTSDDGVKVSIATDKNLLLQRTASKNEVKKAFD